MSELHVHVGFGFHVNCYHSYRGDTPDALAVPISVLKTDANGSYVVVRNADGSQENRYVTTGIYSDEYVEILSGLEEGEDIVSTYTAKKKSSSSSSGSRRGGPMF